ncbi:MAG: AgmX/PglI C-terminal domain-containing protein [Sandaracinaceae bacterium]
MVEMALGTRGDRTRGSTEHGEAPRRVAPRRPEARSLRAGPSNPRNTGLGALLCASLAALPAAGCGGAPEPEPERAPPPTAGHEEAEPDDGLVVTGTLGTIPRAAVNTALQGRMASFLSCFEQRMGEVEFLGGAVRFEFRIHQDGSVAWTHLRQSTVGDREAERCLLQTARRTRFREPAGGEAEFSWGFSYDPPEDIRSPTPWGPESIGERTADVPALVETCGVRAEFTVTAYVEPGGQVLTAGGSTPDADAEPVLDCIVAQVREWEMPDPGSYAAKVTFPVR